MKIKNYKALRKDFYIEVRNTYNRFISLILIVALGVAFYTGVRSTEPDMKLSVDKLYDDSLYMDLMVTTLNGMTQEDINKLKNIEDIETVTGSYEIEAINEAKKTSDVLKIMSITSNVNRISIVKGRKVENKKECVLDALYLENNGYSIGDKIKLKSSNEISLDTQISYTEYKIVGTFTSPMYIQADRGNCSIGNGKIAGIMYVDESVFKRNIYSCAYINIKDSIDKQCYTKEYESLILNAKEKILKINPQYMTIDRNMQSHYVEFEMDAKRVGEIGNIVPVIFFVVAALVSLTTMTRMVEEERTQIGVLKALGYGKLSIASKYIMYGFLATVTGSIIGGIVGSKLLPFIIINAYKIIYKDLSVVVTDTNFFYYGTSVALAMICVIGATILASYKILLSSSANLMRPLAPKEGKKVFLEYIPFIWKKMNFTWKSTIRNLMRYKKRIFMTIFGICGCMSLLMVGFGLKDSISSIVEIQYNQLHKYSEALNYSNNVTIKEREEIDNKLTSDVRIKSFLKVHFTAGEFAYKERKLDGYIYITDDSEKFKDYITLRDAKSKKQIEINNDSVIITKKMSKLLNIYKGDTISIKGNNGNEYKAVVGGIAENYVYHYVFMNMEFYKKIFGNNVEFNQILVNQNSEYKSQNITSDLLKLKGIGSTNSIDTLRTKFSEMLKGLNIIILVIIIAAGGLAFVVLYNLNTINISERMRELATIKVLGFYDKEVSAYVFRENIVLTIVGIIVGYIAGNVLHTIVINTVEVDLVMFGRNIYFSSYLFSTGITLFFSIIINGIMHWKLKKIDMATSLKSVE